MTYSTVGSGQVQASESVPLRGSTMAPYQTDLSNPLKANPNPTLSPSGANTMTPTDRTINQNRSHRSLGHRYSIPSILQETKEAGRQSEVVEAGNALRPSIDVCHMKPKDTQTLHTRANDGCSPSAASISSTDVGNDTYQLRSGIGEEQLGHPNSVRHIPEVVINTYENRPQAINSGYDSQGRNFAGLLVDTGILIGRYHFAMEEQCNKQGKGKQPIKMKEDDIEVSISRSCYRSLR